MWLKSWAINFACITLGAVNHFSDDGSLREGNKIKTKCYICDRRRIRLIVIALNQEIAGYKPLLISQQRTHISCYINYNLTAERMAIIQNCLTPLTDCWTYTKFLNPIDGRKYWEKKVASRYWSRMWSFTVSSYSMSIIKSGFAQKNGS